MRTHASFENTLPPIPLLDAGDLPGTEDWSVLETLRYDDTPDGDDDHLTTLAVSREFDT